MPVTQRFVHFGLVLAVGLFAVSICLLIMGASRSAINDAGLPGSTATEFHLKDSANHIVSLSENRRNVHVLIVSRVNSPLLAKSTDRIQQLCKTFAHDPAVTILGIQFDPSAGILDASSTPPTVMNSDLADLHTVFDFDGAVARAYRVGEVPALFVIDDTGTIRSREAIDGSGLSIATTETIASLRRPQTVIFTQPTDRLAPQ